MGLKISKRPKDGLVFVIAPSDGNRLEYTLHDTAESGGIYRLMRLYTLPNGITVVALSNGVNYELHPTKNTISGLSSDYWILAKYQIAALRRGEDPFAKAMPMANGLREG